MTRQRSKYQGPFPSFFAAAITVGGVHAGEGKLLSLSSSCAFGFSLSISRWLRRGDRLMTSEGEGKRWWNFVKCGEKGEGGV